MRRTWIVGLFFLVLLGGTGMFLAEYFTQAQAWIVSQGSAHVYNNGNLGYGRVYDRDGNILLDIGDNRSYSENSLTRQSTLHWLGDRKGFIKAGAITNYVPQMVGFDKVNGVYHASESGGSATMTLSSPIQNAAMLALTGHRGTIGVYNYRTGEILCAVSTPTYDPDDVPDLSGSEYEGVYLNRFLQSAFVPGSIFKTVTVAAALETVPGIENRTFTCTGRLTYEDSPDAQAVTCEKAHGTLDLRGALNHSCNCVIAQVAKLVGRKNMEKYVDRYQVVAPLTFDGVTTAAGQYDISNTGAVSYAWSTIGQHTDLINPARFMTFMGAIANGGQGVEPYLVSSVTDGEKITYEVSPQKTPRYMSPAIAETMQDYLRSNVVNIYGAGNFPGMTVCGKSGTSQLGGGQKSNAMFAGFVMDEDLPLAFIVVVENGGYGASTCVPILSQVLNACKTALRQG